MYIDFYFDKYLLPLLANEMIPSLGNNSVSSQHFVQATPIYKFNLTHLFKRRLHIPYIITMFFYYLVFVKQISKF